MKPSASARHSFSGGMLALVAAATVAACGGGAGNVPVAAPAAAPAASASATLPALPPVATTPDAPFREKPPAANEPLAFQLPAIHEAKLKNGLRVLFLDRRDLPIVAVRVVLKSGAGDDPAVSPLAFALMAEMLELGTTHFDANAISDGYEAIGAEHGTAVSWDTGGAFVKAVSTEVDRALDLMADTVLHPTFPASELAKLKQRRIGRLALDEKNPRWMADNAKDVSIYGRKSPYGKTFSGRKADIEKIGRADLVRAYERLFGGDNAAIVVAGDVAPEPFVAKLDARFGSWRARQVAPRPRAALEAKKALAAMDAERSETKARVVLVDKPGAPQSFVYLAEAGSTFGDPDRVPLTVMDSIFGGLFSSRINMNLREKNAYSYGVRSAMWLPHGQGLVYAGGAVKTAKTGPAVAELLAEATRITSEPVAADELADAKEYLRLGTLARFETVRDATAAAGELVAYGLPLDEFEKRQERIARVTVDEVARVAKDRIHPDRIKVVVVGDLSVVRPQIEALKLGDVEVRDAYGDPAKP